MRKGSDMSIGGNQPRGANTATPASTEKPAAGSAAAAASPKTDIYRVVGPGSLMRVVRSKFVGSDGRERDVMQTVVIRPGELIELTAEEAKSYGTHVALGEPPPPPVPEGERKAGKYRTVRNVMRTVPGDDGKRRTVTIAPGNVIDLSEEDARSLGAAVAPV